MFEATEQTPPMQQELEPQVHQEEPLKSLHALYAISTPQTLKLTSYIKHHKVVILVDCDSTHNSIHRWVAKELHNHVHPMPNFQIMIANDKIMKCGWRHENLRLQLGDYHLKTHMLAIDADGCDIVLGAK